MKKTKVKIFMVLIISLLALLCMSGNVQAAEGYKIEYETKGENDCTVTVKFDKEIDKDSLSNTWTFVDNKTISKETTQLGYGYATIRMADKTSTEIEYAAPAVLLLDGSRIILNNDIKNYEVADASIAKLSSDGKELEGVKAGKTTVKGVYTTKDGTDKKFTWEIEVKGKDNNKDDDDNKNDGNNDNNGNKDDNEGSDGTGTQGDWTDTSKWTYELKGESDDTSLFRLRFSNVSTIKDHSYHVWMSNSEKDMLDEGKIIEEVDSEKENKIYFAMESGSNNNWITTYIDNWLEKSGDIYFQIVETYKHNSKVIYSKTKLERPNLKLGTRMSLYFFDESTDIISHYPKEINSKRNVKIEVGKITDNKILKSIKDGESDCLQKLLDYAKKTEPIYTNTINETEKKSILKDMNILDGEYYYVYAVATDENGKYYPIEDISLYRGAVGVDSVTGKGYKHLINYLDRSFVWNLTDMDNKDNSGDKPDYTGKKEPTKTPPIFPQAGANLTIVAVIAIVGAIVFVSYKKNKNIKTK